MTNKKLSDFRNAIHSTLNIGLSGGSFIIREMGTKSKIKKICFNKGNFDDILIIRQDADDCQPIKNLFKDKSNLSSCDFIVLICKNGKLHIFFCEMKSSMLIQAQNNDEKEKRYKELLKQFNASKIFLEYLCKNYKEYFDKDFDISQELANAKNIYIYSASNSQKGNTFAPGINILPKNIKVDGGISNMGDIYRFFGLKRE